MRLSVDAHASIAFLAGASLGPKSGCDVTLVQKGRVGARDWRADDKLDGLEFDVSASVVGRGPDLLVAIGATHDVRPAAEAYARKRRLRTGSLLDFRPAAGPGGAALAGGAHAARLADQVTREIRAARTDPDAVVHLFAACPTPSCTSSASRTAASPPSSFTSSTSTAGAANRTSPRFS